MLQLAPTKRFAVISRSDTTVPRLPLEDAASPKALQLLERHGYFVVRNRGQLSRNVTQGQALSDEAQYFTSHQIFGKLAQRGRFGAPALAQYLAEVLQEAARDPPAHSSLPLRT